MSKSTNTVIDSASPDLVNIAPPYRAIFEQGAGLMCTHALDGTLLSINPAASSLLGYEISELIGKNLAVAIPESARKLFSNYLSRIEAKGADQGLFRVCTRDGSERLLLYNNALFNPENGGAPFVLANALDLTTLKAAEKSKLKEQFAEREQMEDVLRATRERLSTALQNAPVILFAMDSDGIYTMAEGKALADLGDKRRLVGKSVFDVFASYP
ncbi:MAG: sensor diguanylate cyclase [Candidatus Angelobacter sp.]|jgi:PAS domain S-box-containing protein|nr:sensor diguanylate cyclase [Candidatus Angelobacter sp.]